MPTNEEWIEAGIVADRSLGHPAKRSPEEGIAEMKRRIEFLELKRDRLKTESSIAELATIESDLRQARELLDAYRLQLKSRN